MKNVVDTSVEGPRKGIDRRVLAIVLGFVGAAALLTAAFSKSWMANPEFSGVVRDRDGKRSYEGGRYFPLRGDIRFGPLGFEHCETAEERHFGEPGPTTCESLSTSEFNALIGELDPMNRDRYTSSAFSLAGWIAFATSLVAAAGLIIAAAMALARKQKQLPVSPASVAVLGVLGALISGCVFVATKPGPAAFVGVDVGFWAFGIGAVVGIIGAQMLAKQIRPPDPDLLADAMDPDEFAALPGGTAPPADSPDEPKPPGDVSA